MANPSSASLPGALDFVHYQGDTFRRSLIFDVDIVGWTWQGEVRRAPLSEGGIADATFTFTPVGNKEVSVEIESMQTASLTGVYVYDIEATTTNGDVFTVAAGKFTVTEEVTP